MPTPVDSATVWLTEVLLGDTTNEADQLAVAQMHADHLERPLEQILAELDDVSREEPGQFGLEHAAFLLWPLVAPAIHEFVKLFAKKFFEGAASEAGKMTATALKTRISGSFSKDAAPEVRKQALTDLETCFAQRAAVLNLPRASYNDLLQQVRDNPQLLL